jgi:hypothetical protein
MKQCFQNIRYVHSGANPLHRPSPKNKKATYNCPVAVPQTGRGMCKWLPSVDRNDNAFIISILFQVVLSSAKNIFNLYAK